VSEILSKFESKLDLVSLDLLSVALKLVCYETFSLFVFFFFLVLSLLFISQYIYHISFSFSLLLGQAGTMDQDAHGREKS
jgi:hypothetical protein